MRKIEESILFDVRFIYLLNNEKPSYVTISKFLNNIVVKHYNDIVSLEFMLTCLDFNICKLFSLFYGNVKTDYWIAPSNLKEETIPKIDFDKIFKKTKDKGINVPLGPNISIKK